MKKIVLFLLIALGLFAKTASAQYDKNQKKVKKTPEQTSTTQAEPSSSKAADETDADNPEEKKGFDPHKLVISPIIGLTINPIIIQLEPKVGYRFTKKIIGGVSFNYVYYNGKGIDPNTNLSYTSTSRILGGGLFGSYSVNDFIFGAADLELNSYKSTISELNQHVIQPTVFYPSFLVGAGLNFNGLYFKGQSALFQQNPFYQNRIVTSVGYFFQARILSKSNSFSFRNFGEWN